MLGRHMFGYAPSLIVTALVSFASVTVFTSYMSQAEYGQFALAINAMTMLIGICFYWLQSAASRLMPQAVEQGNGVDFASTLYGAFAGCGIVLLAVASVMVMTLHLGDWRIAAWYAAPLAILRALLNLNQAFHRNFVRIARYNMIEIGQGLIGLGAGTILIVALHHPASGGAMGAMIGLAAMALFDWRMLAEIRWRNFDRALFAEIFHFGWPFIITNGLSFILARSDSFLIEHFLGSGAVGIYAAGYAFPDRIGQNLFMAVATASFPLVVRRMESEGVEAARDQTYNNGTAILALAVPACIGLLLVNKQVAASLIGANFREGVEQIMPWIAVATILNGIAAHYFDHAFHLAKQTRLFFFTLGPAAMLNLVGNMYAIPHFGIMGAAYTTLASYSLYLALSIFIGRSVFRIKFPFRPALQIALSTATMALILLAFHFPENLTGLVEMVVVGGAVYGLGALTFDIMGVRSFLVARLQSKQGRICLKQTGLSFEILTGIAAVDAIADEWQALYEQNGKAVFGSYAWFQLWWRDLGSSSGVQLHIVIARAEDRLVALLPLAVRRSGILRILEWAGYEVFDYGDVLAESPAAADAIWYYAGLAGRYDIALIKDVREAAVSLSALNAEMRLREQRKNYFLTLDFASGDAWLAAQSRKLRGDTRRKTEKMQARGAVAFNAYNAESLVPVNVIDALYEQKSAWFRERKAAGVFARPQVKTFLHDLAHDAARQGILYLAWLTCGDDIVACHMGFVRDGVLHLYHTTYDAAYGTYSPGNIMMSETIKWAVDARLRELDFMRGDESYKQRFASGNRDLSAFVAGRSRLGKISIMLHKARGAKNEAAAPATEEPTES